MHRFPFQLLAVATLTLLTASADAADPKNVKEADKRFAEGKALMDSGKFDEARVKFAQASVLVRSTQIVWNLVICEYFSGHYVEALNHARAYVRDPKADPRDVERATTIFIPESASKVGQVQIDAPAGLQIEVDKDKAGHAPLLDAFAVAPGAHEVFALDGERKFTKHVEVAAGQTVRVQLGPPPPPASALDVSSMLDRSAPAPETHPVPPPAQAPKERSKAQKWATVGLAVGAVGLGITSIVFVGQASDSSSDVDRLRTSVAGRCPSAPDCSALSSAIDSHNQQLGTAYALAGGAALLAAGAAFTWFVLPKKSSSTAVLVPIISDHAGGFSFSRDF